MDILMPENRNGGDHDDGDDDATFRATLLLWCQEELGQLYETKKYCVLLNICADS